MKKIFLSLILISFLAIIVACNEEPYNDEKTVNLQYLPNSWSLVKYEISTPSGSGAIVTTTQLDGAMHFVFNGDNTMSITDHDVVQANGIYNLYEADNTLELVEYTFVDGVEPEGIASLLLPIVVDNRLLIEELSSEVLTVSMPYSSDTRFIAYFFSK